MTPPPPDRLYICMHCFLVLNSVVLHELFIDFFVCFCFFKLRLGQFQILLLEEQDIMKHSGIVNAMDLCRILSDNIFFIFKRTNSKQLLKQHLYKSQIVLLEKILLKGLVVLLVRLVFGIYCHILLCKIMFTI